MKKSIALLALMSVMAAAIVYFSSNLTRDTATATFSKSEEKEGMNTLKVEAPHGYHVIRYDVVPRWPPNDQSPFKVGGSSIRQDPIGLFDDVTAHSTMFPSEGRVDDIPVEKHVRISSDLNTAATAELPDNQAVLERCGTYVFVTKDRSVFDRLESLVSNWSLDEKSGN
jgi:hypothetical protein